MSRIGTYPNDRDVQATDRLFGTDQSTGRQMNYQPDDLSNYFSKTGQADPSRSGIVYKYEVAATSDDRQSNGSITVPGSSTNTPVVLNNTLTNIILGVRDVNGVNVRPILEYLVGGDIKINVTQIPRESNYGVYTITSVSNVVENGVVNENFVNVHLSSVAVSANSNIANGDYISISPLSSDSTAGGGQPNQNAFSHVAVPGSTTVDADAVSDTLTIEGTGGISITTDPALDIIRFNFNAGTGAPMYTLTSNPTTIDGFVGVSDSLVLTAGATNFHPLTIDHVDFFIGPVDTTPDLPNVTTVPYTFTTTQSVASQLYTARFTLSDSTTQTATVTVNKVKSAPSNANVSNVVYSGLTGRVYANNQIERDFSGSVTADANVNANGWDVTPSLLPVGLATNISLTGAPTLTQLFQFTRPAGGTGTETTPNLSATLTPAISRVDSVLYGNFASIPTSIDKNNWTITEHFTQAAVEANTYPITTVANEFILFAIPTALGTPTFRQHGNLVTPLTDEGAAGDYTIYSSTLQRAVGTIDFTITL